MSGKKKKGKVICPCLKITKKDVKRAVREGASSFREVRRATGAGEACGHCSSRVKKYVRKRLQKEG